MLSTVDIDSTLSILKIIMGCDSCVVGLIGFLEIIGKKEVLLEWLRDHDVIPREKKCEKCGKPCSLKTDFRFVCGKTIVNKKYNKRAKTRCSFSASARKNTIFSQSRLPIEEICKFVLFWSHLRPPRTAFIMKELGMSSTTVVDWSSFCREVCIHWCHKMNQKIGGVGVTVEIDQAQMRKRKSNRGSITEEKWVFGVFERGSKKLFLCGIQDRTKETLLAVIKDIILPGTTIISDCSKAYDCLKDEGFEHVSVNRSINFVDPTTGAHTQNIERCWRDVWGSLPRYGRKELHLEGYLCEFLWKRSLPNHLDRLHSFFKMAGSTYYRYDDDMELEVIKIEPFSECNPD